MNTNLISRSTTKSLPNFPVLVVGKHKMCVTKHFTNLPLWCSLDEVAILNWLVYQVKADNTFEYKTRLLDAYTMSCVIARREYRSIEQGRLNLSYLRRVVLQLIEKGLLLQTGVKNRLMINPMLCYNPDIISNKRYEEVMKKHQECSAETAIEITNIFTNLVAQFLESKKKNYKFNQK